MCKSNGHHKHTFDTYMGVSYVHLTYGDQTKLVSLSLPFLGQRMGRTAKRMVARHDRYTIKGGKRKRQVAAAVARAEAAVERFHVKA